MKELAIIQSKLKAPKGNFNEFGKYRYRSCEDILEALKPLLAETATHLTFHDDIVLIGERYYLKTTAILSTSDGKQEVTATGFAREAETKSGMDVAQITGAAMSYARKYALGALFAIDDTKDADALNVNAQYTQPAAPSEAEVKAAIADTIASSTDRATFEAAMKKYRAMLAVPAFSKACQELATKYPKR